ncbi:MAG: hypothetical protein LQ345_004600 [Seirophora villosa]|nr:MAG: hypothetical protein LQ345_004600 [Seirophora villosa]
MPRLPPQLISQARNIDPLIPLLLRSCRDLHSARNELRWLREHLSPNPNASNRQKSLRRLCIERSRGKPLQYILGDQPFGNLEILCRTGVLIPRPETETWATNLATLIPTYPPLLPHGDDAAPRALRILDLCTGTGCIALLLHSLLHRTHPSLQILGIDVSSRAIALARRNLHHNVSSNHLLHSSATEQIRFKYGDIFNNENNKAVWRGEESEGWDIVVANPPGDCGNGGREGRGDGGWGDGTGGASRDAGSGGGDMGAVRGLERLGGWGG